MGASSSFLFYLSSSRGKEKGKGDGWGVEGYHEVGGEGIEGLKRMIETCFSDRDDLTS